MKKLIFLLIIGFTSCVTVKPTPTNVAAENRPTTTIVKKRTVLFYNKNYRDYRNYNRYYYKPYYRQRRN